MQAKDWNSSALEKQEYFKPVVLEQEACFVFYELHAKLVDSAEAVPDTAKRVLYYTFAMGHHVGVCDCFKEILRMPCKEYQELLAALEPYPQAYQKLKGAQTFGEIQIDRSQASYLSQAFYEAYSLSQNPALSIYLERLSDMMCSIAQEPALYLIVKFCR